MIQIENHDGNPVFHTVSRGVKYYMRRTPWGKIEVSSYRVALGRSNVGTHKQYDSYEEAVAKTKAFEGLQDLMEMEVTSVN